VFVMPILPHLTDAEANLSACSSRPETPEPWAPSPTCSF
jgi:hypothetical protein